MGKVNIIKKSRKECTCNRCQQVIPVGSEYYRGTINFHPDIIRCKSCGLQVWEVTTSDYQLSMGEIVYNWKKNYGVEMDSIQSIIEDLESIRDDLQDKLDNMPEQLHYSDTGVLLQDRIEQIESSIGELETIEEDDIKEVVEIDNEVDEDEETTLPDGTYKYEEEFQETLIETIEEALNNIEV